MEWRGEIVRLRYLAGDLACNDHPAHATRSARRQPETAAPYNAQLAVFFVWEHKRSLSSHRTTTSLSLLIYCNRVRDFCKIDTPKTMVNTPLYVPFSTSSIYRVREGGSAHFQVVNATRERGGGAHFQVVNAAKELRLLIFRWSVVNFFIFSSN